MKRILSTILTTVLTASFLFVNIDYAIAQNENQGENQQSQSSNDVIEVIQQEENDSEFLSLLEEAEVVDMLKQDGPWTLVVPTNQALENIDVDSLKQRPEQLMDYVMGHVLQGTFSASVVANSRNIEVSNGDIEASNGLVHFVSEPIINTEK